MTILPLIFGGIIGFVIIMYVLLDGFDLGIGILYPFIKCRDHRIIMMSTIAPVWDGNETWLVLGGAILYAAFPIAYSTLLPILYLPIMMMLISLVFRGVAFEFCFKANRSRPLWDSAFNLGSTVAAFCQGVILGTFVQGFANHGVLIRPGQYEWFTPFSITTGVAVIAGYALLGSTWLIGKTIGELQDNMNYISKRLLAILLFFLVVVSIWTPFIDTSMQQRWFSLPNFFYLLPLPIITLVCTIILFWALHFKREFIPFFMSVGLFICAYAGFIIGIWPYVIPRSITIWQAAAPANSLIFTLVGVVILLPTLLAYTAYSYVIFKGKVTSTMSVHY